MFKRITMMQGSSIDMDIAEKVYELARNKERVLVVLDSDHTHEHIAKELQLYSHLVTKGAICWSLIR